MKNWFFFNPNLGSTAPLIIIIIIRILISTYIPLHLPQYRLQSASRSELHALQSCRLYRWSVPSWKQVCGQTDFNCFIKLLDQLFWSIPQRDRIERCVNVWTGGLWLPHLKWRVRPWWLISCSGPTESGTSWASCVRVWTVGFAQVDFSLLDALSR